MKMPPRRYQTSADLVQAELEKGKASINDSVIEKAIELQPDLGRPLQIRLQAKRRRRGGRRKTAKAKRIVSLFGLIAFASVTAFGQRSVRPELIPLPPPMQFIDRILRPCPPGGTPFVSAIAAADGDFDITTCTGRSVTVNGVPLVITPGGRLR